MAETAIVEKLSNLMVGKQVTSVLHPAACGCVAQFVMSDGTSFRLHASDMGAWVEETVAPGGAHSSLTGLLSEYGHYAYGLGRNYNYNTPPPSVKTSNGVLELVAPDGRTFTGEISKFTPEDQTLVNHPKGEEILTVAADMGDAWEVFLSHSRYPDICPPELSRR